jgi:hypothetical protein
MEPKQEDDAKFTSRRRDAKHVLTVRELLAEDAKARKKGPYAREKNTFGGL